jgi:hypothetical protein
MPVRETPMVRRYWSEVGGALFLEFPLVRRSESASPRWLDGLIIPDLETCAWTWAEASARGFDTGIIEGRDVIAVQAKYDPRRLCMPLLGQTFFAVELLKDRGPASVEGVALCRADDSALRRVFEAFPNMRVEVAGAG